MHILAKNISCIRQSKKKYIKDNPEKEAKRPHFVIVSAGCGKNPVEFVFFKAYFEHFKIPYLCVGIDANLDHILKASSTFKASPENIKFYYGDISIKETWGKLHAKLFPQKTAQAKKEIPRWIDHLHLGHPPVFMGHWVLKFLIPRRDKNLTGFKIFLDNRLQEILKSEGTITATNYTDEELQALKNILGSQFSGVKHFSRQTNLTEPFPRCAAVSFWKNYQPPSTSSSSSAEANERYYHEMRQWLRCGLLVGLVLAYIAYHCGVFSENLSPRSNHPPFGY